MAAEARSRAVMLGLACLAHVGLVLLLVDGFAVLRYPAPARDSEPLLLTLIDRVRPEPQPAEVPAPVLTPPSEIFAGPVPEVDSTGSAFAPPVSDLVPRVDWVDERRREVAHVVGGEVGHGAGRDVAPVREHGDRAGTRCIPPSARAMPGAIESGRLDRVPALAQGCEPPRRAQHVVE